MSDANEAARNDQDAYARAHEKDDEITALRAENERFKSGYHGACYVCEYVGELNEKLLAKNEKLRAALHEAGEMLEWGARQMKGNCRGSDVDAMNLAAGRTAAALKENADE